MKIGVVGCAGRMGQMLVREIAATPGCTLAGGTERVGGPTLGKDIGVLAGLEPLGVVAIDDAAALFAEADAVIDFTSPEASVRHAALAAQSQTVLVIGTTGIGPAQQEPIAQAATHTPIVQSPNMSLGVNLLLALVEQVGRALGDEYDIDILEMHHRNKVDAPSGTALGLGRAAAAGRGVALEDVWQKVRDGHTGVRPRGEIGFATLRGGDVIGDHTVVFAAEGERVELTHKASGRQIYAKGAVRAALWANDKQPGLYSMKDVLGM
ncbi:4-hydroxy-tetrahydrodipicolinate reductase [Azospirillum brasilense]|uniref:4-hydroxy-tetrahydrodipicolinate reductase n=1 Tax=Azospirillum brasilense TaxID=192 RepID=A0A0P0EPU1_AZOBR|nr:MULTISPECIES: 4-hydroxy-tetrahydrodipicolinate reductase [Azospirillum]ALJ34033.1 4-hydroxy-tetrahydrodipicolinate reductase [Azospirillum brasilense]MDW7553001.1 4-hydroxy-tetrahydrodipicolinate reductase [Azospirillum brasilense]MDW7591807.1 4-hydroxy-tetrahydrodipicolinate reductase [Azospirillum brasilense]MDW7627916.1 4-hydroxy-tetrahydrodipicolinate reductase [Azospirillum brasilense]MDX5952615.1 4-hydroxy-tetrahydrodipicolinate reductase [Azospirillum brasilense]